MASFKERILILCKTYPSPSAKYAETSCVAGMTSDGRLIRLYPVPFRLVADDQQFKKWQWITARLEKARDDHRPESHRIFVDTIECDAEPLPSGKAGWPIRSELLAKLPLFSDFAAVENARIEHGVTLARLRPARIVGLDIKKAENPTGLTKRKKSFSGCNNSQNFLTKWKKANKSDCSKSYRLTFTTVMNAT